MAKNGFMGGLFGGGNAAGAGPGAQTRPVPRPDLAAPQPQQAQRAQGNGFPPIFSRGVGGILPERGSEQQQEIVRSLVQAALQAAPASGSPLLAALAPMLGGAALSRADGLREFSQQRDQDAMAATMFGRPMSAAEQELMGIMSNEDAPAFYRNEAERRLRAAMEGRGAPGSGGGGRGGAPVSGPGGGPAPTAEPDEMAVLLDATSGGRLLTETQRRTLFNILRDGDSTSQSRQLAQRLLQQHEENIRRGAENPAGLPPAPGVSTETPQAPVIPAAETATPGGGGFWPFNSGGAPASNTPPPPPGTVPF